MKKIFAPLVLIVSVPALALPVFLGACSEIEWADVIKFNDITYYSDLRSDNVSESDLTLYAWTKQKLSGRVHSPRYRLQNGDAAFLEPNTMVYSIASYDPASRLAAKREGKWYVYEALDRTRTSPPPPSSTGEAP